MIDITRNAVWTEDCGGKMDLDFPVLDCSTRFWADNTCKCQFSLCNGVYLYREREWHEPFDEITLLESDYIEGKTKEECQMKARQWYNDHAVQALELAILKLTEKEENQETESETIDDLKPFDKCLVRNNPIGLWIPALYGMKKDGQYITSAGWQTECVPYEGNEELLGTKNEQKEL